MNMLDTIQKDVLELFRKIHSGSDIKYISYFEFLQSHKSDNPFYKMMRY